MTAVLEFRSVDLLSARDPGNAGEGIRIQVVRGFLVTPEVRGVDYVVAARAGKLVGDRVADNLSVGLAGFVTARTPETWRTLTDSLIAALEEGVGIGPGNLVARAPYLGLATGATATLVARVKNAIEGEILAKRFQRWSIELEAVDPPGWTVT